MEAEAKALLEELRAAQEEHARAIAAANEVRDTLDRARKEYEDARAAEKASEDELARAAEGLARGLQTLDVNSNTSDVQSPVPQIVDSLVECHANIGCYQCYLFLDSHRDEEKMEDSAQAFDVAQLGVRVQFPRVELTYRPSSSGDEEGVVWSTEIERNVDVSQCVVEEKEDHWYLRLPIRPSDKQPLGGFSSFTQVSPVELRPESYDSVCCRGCSALLLGGEGVRPLRRFCRFRRPTGWTCSTSGAPASEPSSTFRAMIFTRSGCACLSASRMCWCTAVIWLLKRLWRTTRMKRRWRRG